MFLNLFLLYYRFVPTIATWTGSYRSMKAWLPKHQSMQLKNTAQVNGLVGSRV